MQGEGYPWGDEFGISGSGPRVWDVWKIGSEALAANLDQDPRVFTQGIYLRA